MDKYLRCAKDIDDALKRHGLGLIQRRGEMCLVDQRGIKVELRSLFRAISTEQYRNSVTEK